MPEIYDASGDGGDANGLPRATADPEQDLLQNPPTADFDPIRFSQEESNTRIEADAALADLADSIEAISAAVDKLEEEYNEKYGDDDDELEKELVREAIYREDAGRDATAFRDLAEAGHIDLDEMWKDPAAHGQQGIDFLMTIVRDMARPDYFTDSPEDAEEALNDPTLDQRIEAARAERARIEAEEKSREQGWQPPNTWGR